MATAVLGSRPEVQSAASPARFYRPELDGLRWFAFLCVFTFHAAPHGEEIYRTHHLPAFTANLIECGTWTLNWFFCLSGYLITALLFREQDRNGRISLRDYYVRRILRIWPLYFFVLFLGFTYAALDPRQKFLGWELLMFVCLLGNWVPVVSNSYVRAFTVAPLWSVSVEEQFYLFWPLLVRGLPREKLKYACLLLVVVAFAYRGLATAGLISMKAVEFGTFGQLDAFALGGALALYSIPTLTTVRRLGVALLAATCWLLAGRYFDRPDLVMPLVAVGSALFLVAAYGCGLRRPWIVKLGSISYGLYAYHMLCLYVVNHARPALMPKLSMAGWYAFYFTVSLAATVVLGLCSYRWIEAPFLRWKEKFTAVASRPV